MTHVVLRRRAAVALVPEPLDGAQRAQHKAARRVGAQIVSPGDLHQVPEFAFDEGEVAVHVGFTDGQMRIPEQIPLGLGREFQGDAGAGAVAVGFHAPVAIGDAQGTDTDLTGQDVTQQHQLVSAQSAPRPRASLPGRETHVSSGLFLAALAVMRSEGYILGSAVQPTRFVWSSKE